MNFKRIKHMICALEGLSIGDALGGFFEFSLPISPDKALRKLPKPPWRYTDDTCLSLSIFAILSRYGEIVQDDLAYSLATHIDRSRGYGLGTRGVLTQIKKGIDWREATSRRDSYGNGGAVRAGLIGAYFFDLYEYDIDTIIEQTCYATEITHSHPESLAGAIAVAIAATVACNFHQSRLTRRLFLEYVLPYVPVSDVKTGLQIAYDLPPTVSYLEAARELGNGSKISTQDTVPFALWCAGENLYDYETALLQAIRAGGDVDTICAIVGSVVAMSTGLESIPTRWRENREDLPDWAFVDINKQHFID